MTKKSDRAGECYDCGAKWEAGQEISGNGHKTKAGKDYWCMYGTNCQGAMKLQGSQSPQATVRRP